MQSEIVHKNSMYKGGLNAPAFWAEELALSESEVARGERVPASEIHADLLAALSELDGELADQIGDPAPVIRGR